MQGEKDQTKNILRNFNMGSYIVFRKVFEKNKNPKILYLLLWAKANAADAFKVLPHLRSVTD